MGSPAGRFKSLFDAICCESSPLEARGSAGLLLQPHSFRPLNFSSPGYTEWRCVALVKIKGPQCHQRAAFGNGGTAVGIMHHSADALQEQIFTSSWPVSIAGIE